MTATEYVNSLIEGQKVSSIPVQLSELQLLRQLIQHDLKLANWTPINCPVADVCHRID